MHVKPLHLAAIAATALAFAAALSPAVAAPPPNIVLIIGDDQAWTDFSFMGHNVIKTPRIDRLAAESAVFPNGYVPTSLCRASLATLLTGLYGHQHKICCNDPPDGIDRAAMHPFIRNAPTLPRLLKDAGYVSFQTGKYWEGHFANAGFTHGMTTKGRHGDEGLIIGRRTMQPIYDFIASRNGKPFFLWYAPMMPHEPHNPPPRLLQRYQSPDRPEKLAKYYAMCEWFDETVGQLLDHLDQHNLRDNTIVLFVIDNGWIQETGAVRTTRGNFAPKSKLSPYDGGLRTPVMIRYPGRMTPGRYDDLVSTIDVVPTLLAAAGIEPTRDMPGLNLLPTASGGGPLERKALYGEIFTHTAVDLDQPRLNLTHRWVREGDWKLIWFQTESLVPELYNLKDDPFETKNLWASRPEQVERLTILLRGWWPDREAEDRQRAE